ncbi:MAG: Glucose-6-phosphate isomerase Pgi [Candidatus Methanohalarchaeum thermophilum]|uniref:Glucose-6-phosphate isomerase Pgi n=1 Tax=Methanohalarchaeum thermophilum TaxID=1903181 RepID=A0A1Q6DUA7_METT1|nr:MAG: Glucose-6-phosphate isomerase Pgi [Candidatus Methanohalarchaeum thermophilum]
MLDDIKKFPDMCEKAYQPTEIDTKNIRNIVITGMGGSGIGGDLLKAHLRDKLDIPIIVNKNSNIPNFADQNTLFFVISYSGNTKETIKAYEQATKKDCKIKAITSNGKLKEKIRNPQNIIHQPPKNIQPRAALPHLYLPMLATLQKNFGLKQTNIHETKKILQEILEKNKPKTKKQKNQAKKLAIELKNTIPIIYSHTYLKPVAYRWKCQLNENSKTYATSNYYPELNHNEVEAMYKNNPQIKDLAVCIIKDNKPKKQTKKSINASKTVLKNAKKILTIETKGKKRLTKTLSTILIGDLTSLYLAILKKTNPSPVKNIQKIKRKTQE